MTDDPYTYPGTDVLINRFNIRDRADLDRQERIFTAIRLGDPPPGGLRLSAEGLSALHRHIFQEVYPWAGEFRSCDLAKPGAQFCRPQFIQPQLEKLIGEMKADKGLESSDPPTFAASAGRHITELNVIHPFREGNGRTNRLLLELLAEKAGHDLHIPQSAMERWMSASEIGFTYAKSGPMADLILDHIKDEGKDKDKGR